VAAVLTLAPVAGALRAQALPDTTPLAAPPGDTITLSVREAVDMAMNRNEQVLMARANAAEAAGIVKQVGADAYPQISADFGYTRNIQKPVIFFNGANGVQQITIGNDNQYSFGLTLSQTLLDFSLGPARSAARLSKDASADQVQAARTSVALAARTAYYDVLLSRALADVQEKALQQAQRRLAQVQDFYRAGTGSEFDLLTAQVEVDNLRPPLIEARNQYSLNRNQLKRTLGLPLDRTVVLTDSFPARSDTTSLQHYLELAQRARPDLKAQRVRVRLQDENLTAQQRSALPVLKLVAGLTRQASSSDLVPPGRDFAQSATAGLDFSVPLFDGRKRSGEVQQAAAQKEREQFHLRQLEEDVRLQVQQAYQAQQAALQRIEASQANVHRAEKALEIAETRFKNGLSTQVELNDAELAVTRARTNRAQALHDYGVARANLLAAVGER
jgi:outer membrane protein TolC